MRALHAYIREHLADNVIGSLQSAGCHTLSVLEVRGISPGVGRDATEPSAALAQQIERVVKLEIVGSDDETAEWASVIQSAARTGRAGDGLVCIMPLLSAVPIHPPGSV